MKTGCYQIEPLFPMNEKQHNKELICEHKNLFIVKFTSKDFDNTQKNDSTVLCPAGSGPKIPLGCRVTVPRMLYVKSD